MVQVKADALEESFDALEEDEDGVAALRAELAPKGKSASGAIAAQRLLICGPRLVGAASGACADRRGNRRHRGEGGRLANS